MSEDLNEYVHSHSLDIVPGGNDDEEMPQFLIPPGADLEKLRGGPTVIFDGLMPKPGPLPCVDAVQAQRQGPHVRDDIRGAGAMRSGSRLPASLSALGSGSALGFRLSAGVLGSLVW